MRRWKMPDSGGVDLRWRDCERCGEIERETRPAEVTL